MKLLDITFFPDSENIPLTIELLDNPGVTIWLNHNLSLSNTRSVVWESTFYYDRTPNKENLWQSISDITAGLAPGRFPLPIPVNNYNEVTQHHLNVWHRWFTDKTRYIDYHKLRDTHKEEFFWLHELNQLVHKWEHGLREWPKTEFLADYGWDVNLWIELNEHGMPDFTSPDIYKYREYHTFDHYDLILDGAIHGKTLMHSFIDNDNPNHWDTTGHHITHGGCKLLLTDYRSKIYKSDIFNHWLTQNNLTKDQVYADYPLGRIVNKDQQVLDKIWNLSRKYHNTTPIATIRFYESNTP